jgi:hypothetical protein
VQLVLTNAFLEHMLTDTLPCLLLSDLTLPLFVVVLPYLTLLVFVLPYLDCCCLNLPYLCLPYLTVGEKILRPGGGTHPP